MHRAIMDLLNLITFIYPLTLVLAFLAALRTEHSLGVAFGDSFVLAMILTLVLAPILATSRRWNDRQRAPTKA